MGTFTLGAILLIRKYSLIVGINKYEPNHEKQELCVLMK